ncbi:homeobox protein 5-like [Drosophila erecta]|uniref:homeobox protein 5-like n=1 Tax=Drosophila erecta TaxID=7220 RepID=UPI000F045045|nr:homeobox protein 5-like [Drosophila erecta]
MVNKVNGKKADKDKERQQEAMLPAAGKNSSNIENSSDLSNINNKAVHKPAANKGQNAKPNNNSNNNSGNNKKNAGKGHQPQQQQRSGKKAKPQRQQIFLQSLPRDSSNYRTNSYRSSIDINSLSTNSTNSSSNLLDTPATLDSGVGKMNPAELLTAALAVPCAKCSKPSMISGLTTAVTASTVSSASSASTSSASASFSSSSTSSGSETASNHSDLHYPEPTVYAAKQYRKSKSYMGVSQYNSSQSGHQAGRGPNTAGGGNGNHATYRRSHSDRRNSFDRTFAERNRDFVPIVPPPRPVLSSSNIAGVMASTTKLTIIERFGKGRVAYPIMQVSPERIAQILCRSM